MTTNHIPHQATHSFSRLVENYLAGHENLQSFFQYQPNREGLQQAIEDRKKYPINRKALVDAILSQYEGYDLSKDFRQQIDTLLSENTYTICTAHQPDLMTGYLYFFYKIIHAAKLADYLKKEFPENHFVPVFYIGSEDNDFDELSVFHYGGKTWRWKSQQTGAVGRMKTDDLLPLIKSLIDDLIPPGESRNRLSEAIYKAYDGKNRIAQAIRYITHEFLGKFGVVVLDADDENLKRLYAPVMQDDLLHATAQSLVKNTSEKLKQHYDAQAYVRPINLFYLKDDFRERIERDSQGWKVIGTDISWSDEASLLEELTNHPDRFSPNVILRGPYQESILPDVAFIGGGSEVAYWMQLKDVFDHYHIFFPTLILRQSALWLSKIETRLQQKLNLSDEDLFRPAHELEKKQVLFHSDKDLSLDKELTTIQTSVAQMQTKASKVDITLNAAAEAISVKIRHLAKNLEKKMMRAEKRRFSDRVRQIQKLKTAIFPEHTLQERYVCFIELYLRYGESFLDYQYQATLPFGDQFLVIKED